MPHNQRKNRLKPSDEERARLIDLIWQSTEPSSDDDIHAWFEPPWKHPEWAIFLALSVGKLIPTPFVGKLAPTPAINMSAAQLLYDFWSWRPDATHNARWLAQRLEALGSSQLSLYDRAHELRVELSRSDASVTRAGFLLNAGLECLAKWAASSDGGGHVYNIYLHDACCQVLWRGLIGEEELAELVLNARLHDALAVGGGWADGAAVESFKVAWRSGRTRLAYLLASR